MFLSMMHRKRVCLLQFVGPSSGVVTLTPRRPVAQNLNVPASPDEESEDETDEEEEEEQEVVLRAEPGGLLAFLCERYDYTYVPEGESLVLQAWFLDEPLRFDCFGDIFGDLEALQVVGDGPKPPRTQHVSLVSAGVRNPGKSDSMKQFWTAMRHSGTDGMIRIPNTRYDMDWYCDYSSPENANMQGKMYSRHQGHLEGIEFFDNMFFNISNGEAAGMDPEQRLTLEVGWDALHQAGYSKQQITRKSAHIGVFVGISGTDWERCPLPPGVCAGNGGFEAMISGRFTYCLNLKGPSFVVNTACSASLVSMHQGRLNLLAKEDPLEAALTTGISINTTPHTFISNCQVGSLSFMGRSFSFDKSADGFGRSEGTSAALFKRLDFGSEESLGLLAGSANNHDGKSASLTAPNGPAQERVIKAVLDATNLTPPEIDCFECHGTGTALGDPIEVGAFAKLYKKAKRFNPIIATTSKTNLGHTEGGAGIAGFLKCMLICNHAESCPNIHLRELNPHMDVYGFPVYFVSEGSTFEADAVYCGVSSFGVSGTNGHSLAYGRNIASSRGRTQLDPKLVMSRKILSSQPKVLRHDSLDWEEWQNLGRPYHDPGGHYQVEVLKGGEITWRRMERPRLRNPEGPFYLQGSFSNWKMELMEFDAAVEGLHVFEVEIGQSGEETFQVVLNLDAKMVYYPCERRCTRRTANISGPAPAPSREDAWLILGEPDSYVRVELFVFDGGSRVSVTWLPVKD